MNLEAMMEDEQDLVQMASTKGLLSNPLMADSLPKTILGSTVVRSGTSGEFFVARTAGIVTVVGWYRPSKKHFLKASPFGLVSMYLKKRDHHCAYRPVASIGGRSLEPAAIILLCI
ncbi:hypothetical protein Tco_0625376 [Tanacetum coccineum]|uniref:Uncharacterized protein n=1 Tax=Tanacetum coccineum TaxID=301880 RepID=A0ABQ4WGM3_9ASTR